MQEDAVDVSSRSSRSGRERRPLDHTIALEDPPGDGRLTSQVPLSSSGACVCDLHKVSVLRRADAVVVVVVALLQWTRCGQSRLPRMRRSDAPAIGMRGKTRHHAHPVQSLQLMTKLRPSDDHPSKRQTTTRADDIEIAAAQTLDGLLLCWTRCPGAASASASAVAGKVLLLLPLCHSQNRPPVSSRCWTWRWLRTMPEQTLEGFLGSAAASDST